MKKRAQATILNLCGLEVKEHSDYNFWSVDFSSTQRKIDQDLHPVQGKLLDDEVLVINVTKMIKTGYYIENETVDHRTGSR